MISVPVDNKDVLVNGRVVRTARLQSEYYVPIGEPLAFIDKMRNAGIRADLFTFVQEIHEQSPKYDFCRVFDQLAVLPITTYDHWFNKQLYFKPRNKLRKAQKSGIQVRVVEFTDELARQIKAVHDETPLRQDKLNWHYGKDLETVKREHSTFLDRSEFIGAFFNEELIGFAKLTYTEKSAILMNIVSMNCHRNRAPTNALLAKAVELCARRNASYLVWGSWRGRGLQDFKVANGFGRCDIPRYFVPFTFTGRVALRLGFHLKLVDYLPRWCIHWAARVRSRLTSVEVRATEPAEQSNAGSARQDKPA
jgi:hypothetical protein